MLKLFFCCSGRWRKGNIALCAVLDCFWRKKVLSSLACQSVQHEIEKKFSYFVKGSSPFYPLERSSIAPILLVHHNRFVQAILATNFAKQILWEIFETYCSSLSEFKLVVLNLFATTLPLIVIDPLFQGP